MTAVTGRAVVGEKASDEDDCDDDDDDEMIEWNGGDGVVDVNGRLFWWKMKEENTNAHIRIDALWSIQDQGLRILWNYSNLDSMEN